MDEDDINNLIRKCRKLKLKLCGVFAANKFPKKFHKNSFLIINASLPNSGFFYVIETIKLFLRTLWTIDY